MVLALLWTRRRVPPKQLAAAAALVFLTVWAGYGFSVHRLQESWGPHPRIDQTLSEHPALQPAFTALCGDANTLLQQLNGTLELDALRQHPDRVATLRTATDAYCARAAAARRQAFNAYGI